MTTTTMTTALLLDLRDELGDAWDPTQPGGLTRGAVWPEPLGLGRAQANAVLALACVRGDDLAQL